MINKPTLVIGASTNPERYSYIAVYTLREYGHDVVALAKRVGQVNDVTIQTDFPRNKVIHTVTIYLASQHQKEYYQSILDLKPQRVIFNPGAENDELAKLLEKNSIVSIEACTLLMLNTGQY